ncbi:MAG TPA: 3'-5' exonuclease [Anaerovoracaceae bacterium]|nr:3'-5' exonuclease [Anaerovoracaceae bacterium]
MNKNNNENFLILDTETTGLDSTAEIVEITVIDSKGQVLLDTLVKPVKPIPYQATAIHGITNEMVANAPTYDEVHPKLIALLKQFPCYIYNKGYDTKLIKQSAQLYDIEFDSTEYEFRCTMLEYSDKHSPQKWAKLINAYNHAISVTKAEPISLAAHRAYADCLMTLEVINFLEYEKQLEIEQEEAQLMGQIQEELAIQTSIKPKFYSFNPNGMKSSRFSIKRKAA